MKLQYIVRNWSNTVRYRSGKRKGEKIMWNELKMIAEDFVDRDWTMAEKILFGLDCLLAGVILGFLFSPLKKGLSIGSNNGCNNTTCNCECEEE